MPAAADGPGDRAAPGEAESAASRAPGEDTPGPRLALIAFLAFVAVAGAVDLVADRPASWWSAHVVIEACVIAGSLGAVAFLGRSWLRDRHQLAGARADRDRARAEHARWKTRAEKLLRGLGEAIDAQFDRWRLTRAEREVALLLLKGFGHKEIARMQERSERTIRQHAISVYRKSGLGGRAELSAFFLEDLLLPSADDEGGTDAEAIAWARAQQDA
jgi:DNA-binding CsgD family transcriptional regulator